MINVSAIRSYMYCPMKLYLQSHVDQSENSAIELNLELKKIKIDTQDLIQKNMRKLKKEMNIAQIEDTLSENVANYLESTFSSIQNLDLGLTNDQIIEINNETYFNIKLQALKSKQAMELLGKNGFGIVDMFFPNCMYSYLLKDQRLELIGLCDKIEIVDGKYYPISIKHSNPPLKGVWDQDAMDLAANAVLIEEEFETEIFVGFVEYSKINERRPVVMDVNLRKSLFNTINEVKEIEYNKKVPTVKINDRKCGNCEYKNICIKE
ncbi:MAG: CRISPR-associated protein Cas4 [Methanobrevibacter sp.]|nr:CRISPR-associated protein Cas4 [Methanobrevibacter sp.]